LDIDAGGSCQDKDSPDFLTLLLQLNNMNVRSIAVFIMVLSVVACSKDNGTNIQPPYMDCKADGATIAFANQTAIQNGSNLQVTGSTSPAGTSVNLSINNISSGQTGTFTIGPGNFNSATFTDATGGYSAGTSTGTGSITISSNNGSSLLGSFQFTGVNLSSKQKLVTEGRFLIYF
jgi:hypothetical protein